MACDNVARIDEMTTTKFPPIPASLTGPALNECPKISKTFIAYLESLLALTPYQSARDTRADGHHGLASANFEQSVEQAGREGIPAILAAQDEEMAPGLSSDGAC